MGYFLTTSPDQPATRPHASPKTHTPGSRLQERGLRFHSPKLGRWLSRDPIGERGGRHLYAFVSNIPLCLFDPLGLASKLYLIIGPNTGNTTDNFYADPAVPLDNLDATIQSAKDEYKRASGEKCDVEVVIYASSRSSPMGLGELSTYLSSSGLTGDADAIALIFHGETVGGETGLIVYDHYSDRASGWVRGKAYKLSDVISDTSGVAAEVDKLFISCCFNRQLPPNAGGKKIVILGTGGAQGRLEVGVVLTAIGSLVKDLCCRDTTLSGSGDSGGQGENQCCPLK